MAVNNKPTVGGSDGTWGTQLNDILDGLNPTIATGDLIYASATASSNGLLGRLPIGTASSVLTVGAASALQWSSSMNLSGAATIGGLLTVNNSVSVNIGTLSVNETAIDIIPEMQATGASATIALHSGILSGSLNPLVSASDNGIIFYGTASNTGGLVIAPYSSVTTGIRITASNTITLSGSTTLSGGTASITGTASISSSVSVGGNIAVGNGSTGILTLGDAQVSKSAGSGFSFSSGASVTFLYSTSGSINGTLNATTLQQGGNAVPTIVTTARMAQGIATGTTTAAGLLNIPTGLTTVTNIIVSNGASAQTHLVSSASSYSGANASVILRTASTGGVLNAGAASVNWIAFGT